MKFGYARVSTKRQETLRQIDALKKEGCDEIFEEKISGTKKLIEREQLQILISKLREGDILIAAELTRLSRRTKDIFELVEIVKDKKANIKVLDIPLVDTTTPQGELIFGIFAAISKFERDLTSKRIKEALDSKRKRGIKGGRPKKNSGDVEKAIKLYNTKEYTVNEIVKMTGISRATIYRYIREKGDNNA